MFGSVIGGLKFLKASVSSFSLVIDEEDDLFSSMVQWKQQLKMICVKVLVVYSGRLINLDPLYKDHLKETWKSVEKREITTLILQPDNNSREDNCI